MSDALLLTARDFQPLRENPDAIESVMRAVDEGVVAQYRGRLRHQHLTDIEAGELEGLRVSLTAQESLRSGVRVFGNPPHTRAYLLFDRVTRALLAMMDYGVLNSLRVGATSGVAARHLAPAARVVGLVGSGWQAQPQLDALRKALPSLEVVRVFSPTRAHREAFVRAQSERPGLRVEAVDSTRDALRDADIVDLCAPGRSQLRQPLFESSWVKPGALVIAMAPNQCPSDFVQQSRIVATSWEALVQPEVWPPYDRLIEAGILSGDRVTALGSVALEGRNPRRHAGDIVLYHLEGRSACDLFVANWAYDWARARSLGGRFDLSQ